MEATVLVKEERLSYDRRCENEIKNDPIRCVFVDEWPHGVFQRLF